MKNSILYSVVKLLKRQALLYSLALSPLISTAQNDIQLSQQLFNRVYYNPAAAGASQYINGILFARQQWVGFPQAPRTLVVYGRKPYSRIYLREVAIG